MADIRSVPTVPGRIPYSASFVPAPTITDFKQRFWESAWACRHFDSAKQVASASSAMASLFLSSRYWVLRSDFSVVSFPPSGKKRGLEYNGKRWLSVATDWEYLGAASTAFSAHLVPTPEISFHTRWGIHSVGL